MNQPVKLAPSSVLSDGTIKRLVGEGRIKVDPWDPELVQPASLDLRLGNSFRVFHNHQRNRGFAPRLRLAGGDERRACGGARHLDG
jgi:hypothetical protein